MGARPVDAEGMVEGEGGGGCIPHCMVHVEHQHTVFSHHKVSKCSRGVGRCGLAVTASASTSTVPRLKVIHQRYSTDRLAVFSTCREVFSVAIPQNALPVATLAAFRAVGGDVPAYTTCRCTIQMRTMGGTATCCQGKHLGRWEWGS